MVSGSMEFDPTPLSLFDQTIYTVLYMQQLILSLKTCDILYFYKRIKQSNETNNIKMLYRIKLLSFDNPSVFNFEIYAWFFLSIFYS